MTFRFSRSPVTSALLIVIAIVMVFEWLSGALENEEILVQMGATVHELWQRHEY